MACCKNKRDLLSRVLERGMLAIEKSEATVDMVIEQFCLEHKINPKKLKSLFDFFYMNSNIYIISKKIGIVSKQQEEILKVISELEKKEKFCCCDFSYAGSVYNFKFLNSAEPEERDTNFFGRIGREDYEFENWWGNIIRTVEDRYQGF